MLHPVPGGGDDFVEWARGFPLQESFGFCGIRDQGWRVAGTARNFFVWNFFTGDLFDGGDDLLDGVSAAGADVDGKTIFAGGEMVESFDVRGGKIVDVDVVADAGAVGRGIGGAEDVLLWALARCGAEGERDQMCFGIVEFADFSAFVGTGGVEITQGGEAKSVGAVVGFEGLLEE